MNSDTCTIKKGSGNEIIISNVSSLGSRNITKLSLFISAIKSIDIISKDSSIVCEINSENEDEYVVIVKKLYDFIKKINDECLVQEELSQLIGSLEEKNLRNLQIKEQLINAKKDSSNSLDFNSFCEKTDSFLNIKLRDYQYKSAYLFVTGNGGFEFSVPGSGKTIITYSAYAHLKFNKTVNKILIIGPNNSYNAWWDEYRTCFNNEPDFENLAPQSVQECKIYFQASAKNHKEITFINYDKIRLLETEMCNFLQSDNYLLIFDEAHYIKNPQAITTKIALSITRYATCRILLTGTPMPNGYEDLYSLTKVFSPYNDILTYRYEQLKAMTKNDASNNQVQSIKDSIYPYYSRISKQYLIANDELKPQKYHIVNCEMDANQTELYSKLNSFCGKTKDYSFDENLLQLFKKAILIRKMQISANPALLKKSLLQSMDELVIPEGVTEKQEEEIDNLIKIDREIMQQLQSSELIRMINSYENKASLSYKNKMAIDMAINFANNNQKVILWDIFVNNMFDLFNELNSIMPNKIEIICGAISLTERQKSIQRFREGDSMILIANPATLAESISLHRCCQNAIYINRNFNAAQFIQSKDRIHRINMPEGTTATYYFLVNEESVDVAINEKLSKKEKRMLEILDVDDISVGGSEFEDTSIMSISDINDCYRY